VLTPGKGGRPLPADALGKIESDLGVKTLAVALSYAVARTTEVHLVHSKDSVALRPMTLEEAIKEAHFRDRDVFVFRDPKGKLMVLHRTREGKMELIEAP